jgi:hypothetical protein
MTLPLEAREGKTRSIEPWADDMATEVNVACSCIVLTYGGGGCGLLTARGVPMPHIIVTADGEGAKITREAPSTVQWQIRSHAIAGSTASQPDETHSM